MRLEILLAFAVIVVPMAAVQAQDSPRIDGVVEGKGSARIKIAIPTAFSDSAASREAAREIIETLRADLEFSGYFDVVDPSLYRLVPAEAAGEVRHDDWIAIGADTVTRIEVDLKSDRLDVRVRLFQNDSRSELFGTRYGGSADRTRRFAHQISDEIVRQRTGQRGIALTRIAFVSKYKDGKEIYLMDYDGRRIRRLTSSNTINLTPVWSADGGELAYVSWRGRQPGVYAMTAEGEDLRLATVGGNLSSAPDWSRDGRKLVYSSDKPGNTEIFMLDRTTGRNTQLTRHPAIDTSPAFSPNGREIAFTSDRTGAPQIYLMDAEGLNVRRISWTGGFNDSAAWSPSGDRLAYVTRIDRRFDIILLDITTNKTTRLTRGEGNSENPAWSPDGKHLVFASDRAGTYDIYTMSSAGGPAKRLTRNGNCFTPHWSP